MAASQEQKVDFLLKKIGYTASKTGIAEDETGISGTKKAPFAEPIPSPLTLPGANVWAQSNQIPATPPGATTSIVRVYKTGTAQQLTFDSTVADNRSFVSRETPGEVTSTVVGDWVDTQFGADYIVKVYKGDPNAGGVQLSAAGSGSNDTWFFDYSAGVLNFNGTNVPSGITTTNIYIEGYRYTGIKGVTGVAQTFTDLEISGITTFNGAVDMNSTLDVDGDTQLDDLNVAGVSTFSNTVDVNADLNVSGLSTFTQVSVNAGVVTFTNVSSTPSFTLPNGTGGHIYSFQNGLQITGGMTAGSGTGDIRFGTNGFQRWQITSNGDLKPLANNTYDIGDPTNYRVAEFYGQTLDISGISSFTDAIVAGVSTFTGAIDANGNLDVDGDTQLDDLTVAGVATFSSNIDANGNLDVDGQTDLDVLNVSDTATFTGIVTLRNANPEIYFSDTTAGSDYRIRNNGGTFRIQEFVSGDYDTRFKIINNGDHNGTVEATGDLFVGAGLSVTGVSTFRSAIDLNAGLDVDGHTELDDVNVSGAITATTFTGNLAGTVNTAAQPNITSLGTLSAVTVSGNINANGNIVGDSATNITGIAGVTASTLTGTLQTAAQPNVTSLGTLSSLNVTGDVSIGGTLTYEDVTNIDSVGLLTARSGIVVVGNGVSVGSGIVTSNDGFSGNLTGNVIGNLTGNADTAGKADGLTTARTIGGVSFDGSANINLPGVNTSGNQDTSGNAATATALETARDIGGVSFDGTASINLPGVNQAGNQNTSGTAAGLSGSPNITITDVSGVGGNFTGVVTASSGFSGNLTGTVQTAAQPNVTSLGTLTGLTVSGAIDANGDLDVDGHTELDNVNVSGISTFNDVTFVGAAGTNATWDKDRNALSFQKYAKIELGDFLGDDRRFRIFDDGTSRIRSANDISIQSTIADLSLIASLGTITLNSDNITLKPLVGANVLKTSETTAFLYHSGSEKLKTTSTGIKITGIATATDFSGNISGVGATFTNITGTLQTAAQPNITSLGTLSSVTVSGNINANGNIVGDSSTNITGIAGVTASTLTGTLQTAAQPNITSLGTLSSATVSGNINANGNIVGDNSTNISGISSVTATSYFGNGENLTGIGTQGSRVEAESLTVAGVSTFNDDVRINAGGLNVTGISTFNNTVTIGDAPGGSNFLQIGNQNARIFRQSDHLLVNVTGEKDLRLTVNESGGSGGNIDLRTVEGGRIDLTGTGGVGIYHTDTAKKLETTSTGVVVTGIATASKAVFTEGGVTDYHILIDPTSGTRDGKIKYDGSKTLFIEGGTSSDNRIEIHGHQSSLNILCEGQGETELYYSGRLALQTQNGGVGIVGILTAKGVNAIGVVTATSFSGTLITAAQPNITSLGTLSSATVSGNINANGNIVGDSSTNITGIAGVTASTLTGTLQTAAQPNITSVGTLSSLNVTGNVSVGGTLTYEDVTNIDSVGLVTARNGVRITAGGLDVTGVSTFSGNITGTGDLTLTSTDTGSSAAPIINLFRNSASPADADYLGQIKFQGESDTGVQRNYAKITGKILDASNGTEDGIIEFAHIKAGSQTITGRFRSDSLQLLNGTALSVAGDITANGNIAGDGSTNITGINEITAAGNITANGNIIGDDSTNISGINSVTATSFFGNGANLSGVGTQTNLGAFDNLVVAGVSTFHNNVFVGSAITMLSSSGIVSATKFCGDGSFLSGIATSGDAGFNQDSQGNLYAGDGAGAASDSDTCFNIAIGCNAGKSLNSGDHNIFLGCYSGESVTSGSCNIFFGLQAGCSITDGSRNIFIGKDSNRCRTSGNTNISLGTYSAKRAESGSYNISIGHGSRITAISGSDSVAIGRYAQRYVTGNCNVAIGMCAGTGASSGASGTFNVAIGRYAGELFTSGTANVFLGKNAGRSISTGSCNVILGAYAMSACAVTGNNNIVLGCKAGLKFTSTNNSIAIGHYAMGNAVNTSTNSIAIGPHAGRNLTSGQENVFIGQYTGKSTTDGGANIAIGNAAGCSNVSGINNIFIGKCSGSTQTAGNRNIAIGCVANFPVTDGSCQLVIGHESNRFFYGCCSGGRTLIGISTDYPDNAVGAALTSKLSVGIVSAYQLYGDGSNLTGISAGFNADGDVNLFASNTCSGCNLDGSGCYNIFFGSCAGKATTSGDNNILIGTDAGCGKQGAGGNISIGCQAGASGGANTGGNIAIGRKAGYSFNNGNNIAIGIYALRQDNFGSGSVAIGHHAGKYNASGENTFIGCGAGKCDRSQFATFVGNNAGICACTGVCNVFIGAYTGQGKGGGTTGKHNTFVGTKAGRCFSSGCYNAFLGHEAGCLISSGIGNVFLGDKAGNTNTTGSYNIAIGRDVELPSATGDYQLAVGAGTSTWISGTSDFMVGIGTTNPSSRLSVAGDACVSGVITASSFSGDGSNLTGITATGIGAIGGLTVKNQSGSVVGTGGSIATLDFNGSTGVTVTATSGAAGIATIAISGGFSQDSQGNLIAGTGAGAAADSDTCFNIMLGCNSGAALNSGDYNILMGLCSGKKLTSGCQNVFLGQDAGCNGTTVNNSVFIGNFAGKGQSTNGQNVAIGVEAMCCGGTGYHNVTLGSSSGKCITSGFKNIAIGFCAMSEANVVGTKNVVMGAQAGAKLTNGGGNAFFGSYAGCCTTVKDGNTFIGCAAGKCNTGGQNTFIGNSAGCAATSGSYNIAIGCRAGYLQTAGDRNIVIGCKANVPVTTGSDQIALVGGYDGTGFINYFIGCCNAGYTNVGIGTTIPDNAVGAALTSKLSVGILSAYQLYGDGSNLTGLSGFSPDDQGNLKAGTNAGAAFDSDTLCNIAIGHRAGCLVNESDFGIFLGTCAGIAYTGSSKCTSGSEIMIGYRAGMGVTTTPDDIIIGSHAACADTYTREFGITKRQNIYIGSYAGAKVAGGGAQNVFIGSYAGQCHSIRCGVAIGFYAMRGSGHVSGNSEQLVAVGGRSLEDVTCARNTTAIGYGSGRNSTTGHHNFFGGYLAGSGSQTGNHNVFLGARAGQGVYAGADAEIFIGSYTGRFSGTGCNVLIGSRTGCASGAIGRKNVIMGHYNIHAGNCVCCNIIIGSDAGKCSTTAHKNIYIGTCAANTSTAACCNIVIGYDVELPSATTSMNLAIGNGTNRWITGTSDFNVGIGTTNPSSRLSVAGDACVSGVITASNFAKADGSSLGGFEPDDQENLYAGTQAGQDSDADTCFNVAIGHRAGCKNCAGDNNVYVGCLAGNNSASGGNNVAIGKGAFSSGNGIDVVAIGQFAGQHTSVNNSVYIGVYAGTCRCSYAEIAIGCHALQGSSTVSSNSGAHNVALGSNALRCGTSGAANVVIGEDAGKRGATAFKNIFIGRRSGCGCENHSAGANVFVGQASGREISTGRFNVMLGNYTGKEITTGYNNVFLGSYAGCSTTTGCSNIAIGYCVKLPSATGHCQLAIGYDTNRWITGTSDFMVGIGTTNPSSRLSVAGDACVSGVITATNFAKADGSSLGGFSPDADENLFAGTDAGGNLDGSSGCFNVLLGKDVGKALTSGANNTILGCGAGEVMTSGSCNVIIGKDAMGHCDTTGSNNVAIGCMAGRRVAAGNENVFIGKYSGANLTTGCTNIIVGNAAAGTGAITGNHNIFMGQCSGKNTTSGATNIALGHYAMGSGTVTGKHNIAMGCKAGCNIAGAFYNVLFGFNAGKSITGGGQNVFIGACAGCSVSGGAGNVFIGGSAGKSSTGTCNVIIGLEAGKSLGGHNHNIFIGTYAACAQSQGNCNIAIGCKASLPISTGTGSSNQLVIGSADGNWINGNCDFNVGIGTTNPSAKLSVAGDACVSGVTTFAGPGTSNADGSTTISKGLVVIRPQGANSATLTVCSSESSAAVGPTINLIRDDGAPADDDFLGILKFNGSNSAGQQLNYVQLAGITADVTDGTEDGTLQIKNVKAGSDTVIAEFRSDSLQLLNSTSLTAAGDVSAPNFNSTSDIRYKTNIKPIDDPISKVIQIEGVSFNWKKDDRPALGVIADQVEKILPQLVHGDDPKTVNYNGLVGLLIEVVKDQQKQIDTLSERILKLE